MDTQDFNGSLASSPPGDAAFRQYCNKHHDTTIERITNLFAVADRSPGRREILQRTIYTQSPLLLAHAQTVRTLLHGDITTALQQRHLPWELIEVKIDLIDTNAQFDLITFTFIAKATSA